MAKDDFENGIWRTVGGRRIFIRDGEDLSSAMRRSGKFKNLSDKAIESNIKAHHEDEKLEQARKEKDTRSQKELLEDRKKFEAKMAEKYDDKEAKEFDDKYQKRMHELVAESSKDDQVMSQKEYDKLMRDSGMYEKHKGENINYDSYIQATKDVGVAETNKSIRDEIKYQSSKKQGIQNLKDKLSGNKEEDEAATVKSQMSELEKASGSKVKDAFQTDLFGNGKENRFILEDGTIVGHTLESFGQKRDDWYVGDKNFKSYDEVKKYLSGGSEKSGSEPHKYGNYEKGQRVQIQDPYTGKYHGDYEVVGELDKDKSTMLYGSAVKGYQIKDKDGNVHSTNNYRMKAIGGSKDESTQAREFLKSNKSIQEAEEGYKWGERAIHEYNNASRAEKQNIKQFANEKIRNRNKAYEKAFDEYKKKHPNTKLSLREFMNISEGK